MQDSEPDEHESAPLLSHPEQGGPGVTYIAQEPLTPLTKILLVLTLFLLLLTSIFVGLFAGTQHRLNVERSKNDKGDGSEPPAGTITSTATTTAITTVFTTAITTATTTAITTATSVSTSTLTATVTTTELPTRSTGVPAPTKLPPNNGICTEPQCIILSASILSSLDVSQDPCENFYDFANGGWLKTHPTPADKGTFGTFEALSQQNKQLIQQILESESLNPSFLTPQDDEILHKLRDFYTSCLNEDQLNDIGPAPLLDFVKNIRRLFRDKSETDNGTKGSGLTAAVAFLHSRGVPALFSFDVEGDVGDDPNNMVLWFNQPSLGLPSKEYYEKVAIRAIYTDVVERLLLTLAEEGRRSPDEEKGDLTVQSSDDHVWPPWPWPPWDEDDHDGDHKKPRNWTEKARKLARKVVEFERELARASLDLEVLVQDPFATYNPVRISNLTKTITQMDFPSYFSTFAPRHYPEEVILTYPAYSVSLSNLLDETPPEVVETYLIVLAALNLSPYLGLDTEAWQAQRTLQEELLGLKKGAVGGRDEYCVGQVEERLGFAVGRYFVNETFGGESRDKGTKVIQDIVTAFKQSLRKIEWMDEESARAAKEKASAIRIKVGYPLSPDTRDPKSIAQYYRQVHVDKYDFFENVLQAAASAESKKWQQLGKTRDPEAWEMYPSTVNAYFNPPANEIVFPAGILQAPFFVQNWPSYISYGAFGQVAAHELTHAFDSAGRLYNQEGKLEEWWTEKTSEEFKKRQDCIVQQFSEYTIDDGKGGKIHVNGNLTSGENIGDSGLIQAYRAWKVQYQESLQDGNEYLLPGLDYTREQLFFISFARIWARNMKPEAAIQRIWTDPHSPTRYRVEGTVSNIPEFAEAFKCSKNAKLNPPREKRCIFWS
jgi:endothelin-converting enzyme